jgi:TonB family protein
MNTALGRVIATSAVLLALTVPAAAAGASIEDARKLYADASFEGSLAALRELEAGGNASLDTLELKSLCLIALGRAAEAQTVIDQIITTTPSYLAPANETSPRFVALVNDARRRLLPEITKKLFNTARDQFRARDNAGALKNFEEVLRLADDAVWEDDAEAEDLRTLASGFVDLVNAAARSTEASAAPSSAAASAPADAVALPSSARRNTVLRPPVVIEQVIPTWRPMDPLTAARRFTGAVRIRIDTDGRVASATIEVPTNPQFDQQILQAAKSWRYVPGQRNGEPIEMDKLVRYSLRID